MTPTERRNGAAFTLADLVNEPVHLPAVEVADEAPEGDGRPALAVRAAGSARKARRSAAPGGGDAAGWAGPVPRKKIAREQLNAGLPVELDLLRRLRRYAADTGVDQQDYVAHVLHVALEDLGYGIDRRA